MRRGTIGGRRTPSPPTSPPGPKYEHSEHRVREEPTFDFDGPGKSEAEQVDAPIFTVVRERYRCRREGCEARGGYNHVYTLSDLSRGLTQAVRYAVENAEWFSGDMTLAEGMCEYASVNAEVVEYDGEQPVLAITFGEARLGYVTPGVSVSKGSLDGSCNGRPLEPNPEPYGL